MLRVVNPISSSSRDETPKATGLAVIVLERVGSLACVGMYAVSVDSMKRAHKPTTISVIGHDL